MDFSDYFRFNAKRATLVQSCVKIVERWIRMHLQKLKLKLNGLATFAQRTYQSSNIVINDALDISFAKILPCFDVPKAIIESQALQILDSEQANEFLVSHFLY